MFDKRKESSHQGPKAHYDAGLEDAKESRSRAAASKSAVIGARIRINGDVSGDEDLAIDGKVEGKIKLTNNQVIIGHTGKVHADITAKVVRIEGEVRGDVSGSEKVIISRTGNVQGNIVAPRLTLEDGAKFKGSIDMDPGEAAGESAGASSASGIRSADKAAGKAAAAQSADKVEEKASEKLGGNGRGHVPEKSKPGPGLALKGE